MKTVVITGVSSGIGFDLAKLLIDKKYRVIGISRRKVHLEGLTHFECDITKIDDILEIKKKIEGQFRQVDYLINNAGMGIAGPIKDSSYNDINLIFNTNVLGTIMMTKELLPLLIKAQGRIINIGSVAGDLTIPYQGFYSMSKSAIDKFSEALLMELHPYKIKVTTVMPGDTKTGFTSSRITKVQEGSDYDIANNSIAKMARDEENGVSPRKVSNLIWRVMKRKNPPLRIAVGFNYKFLILLQRFLPRKLVILLIRKIYAK